MKKIFVLACAAVLVFGVAGMAGAITYYEEYSGYQEVDEKESYNFGFDFWYDNDVEPVGTDSSLELTEDAEGAEAYPWESAQLFIDFFSVDFLKEKAKIQLTAWDASGGSLANFNLGVIDFSAWLLDPTYSYSYDFSAVELAAFEEWGWGNVSIKATSAFGYFENDFAITKVAMQVEAVPEPGTILLFGAGLLGLIGLGRKKFKK